MPFYECQNTYSILKGQYYFRVHSSTLYLILGYTPLHTAVEQDDIGMMVCLVKHGAYIDAQV